MRFRIRPVTLLTGIAILTGCAEESPRANIRVQSLKCEMLENPVGTDTPSPRLSWILSSDNRSVMQTAYRVMVASSPALMEKDSADLWDTGKTPGDCSTGVVYEGKALNSQMQAFWKVKVWSGNVSSSWSGTQSWRVGLLHYKDWKGRWIGFDRTFPWDSEEMFSRLSARYFRKEFNTKPDKQIQDATVYIMGLGLYELYLNGHKAGNEVLSPAPTDYVKNVKYNSIDVGELLTPGDNAIGVVLGNGRYFTMRQHYKAYKIKNFGYPKLLLNLVIRYTDGTTQTISTNDSWRGTADGPIRSNNEYDGEIYDAGKEFKGWTLPGFDGGSWLQAEYVQEPGGTYEAQMNENMAVMDTVLPISMKRHHPGVYILDMGQNMVGWLKIRVLGERGTTVKLRFAESLNEDGSLFTENLRDAQATDYYTLRGNGPEEWQPAFVYHGFRYVEVSGYPGTPDTEDFTGLVVYDRLPVTGRFTSSDTLLNRLFHNAFWSISGNYKGMPVDCPQRNERQPWLGDRAVGSYGESFLFDNSRIYAKWLDDIMYAQRADGSIPDVAPAYWRYYSDNMTWAGTYLLVADMLYRQFGDLRSLQKHYPFMKKWLAYMRQNYLVDGIMTRDSYGDWCVPPVSIEAGRGKSADVKRPSALISTAYYYHFLVLMQEFAALTHHAEDIAVFRTEAGQVRNAFNKKFLSEDHQYYGNNTLTENLLPLSLGIVPAELEEGILARVTKILEDYGNHLSSGVIGVQWLMRTLSRNGMEDLAFRIATQTTYPSWGYMVENGATTFWELWNGNTAASDMNSQNHVMLLGDLLIWYFEDLAGIRSHPEYPAFKKILMHPAFPKGLDHVDASYRSVHGTIESNWIARKDTLFWDIKIPANTTAEVHLPCSDTERISESGNPLRKAEGIESYRENGNELLVELGSGNYHFTVIRSPNTGISE
jgi:alpha-L-rhamnosidase